MANSGMGTKFVPVNLNKSYGQHPPHFHSSSPNSNGANRTRTSSHTAGGGMVVLSRPRSSQKAGPKLSVPPPLNLPSLRKEHEKFDSFGSGAGISGVGASGSGQRPTAAGMRWTKPGAITMQEKEGFGNLVPEEIDHVLPGSSGSSLYLPPSARPGLDRPSASSSTSSQVNPLPAKATVLRGEDFPSLQAVLPSGNTQKQKDGLNPKAKHISEDPHTEQSVTSHLSSEADTPPQLHLSRQNVVVAINEKNVENYSLAGSRLSHQAKKQGEVFPVPLSLVCLNSRSDWADDERDTSHGLTHNGRDYEFSKKDAHWDKDFDVPRVSALPHKPFPIYSERKGLHDNETGKIHSSEVLKEDPFGRDIRLPSREGREGNFWRNAHLPKDSFGNAAFINDRNDMSAKPSGLNWEKNNDSMPTLLLRENANNNFGRNNTGHRQVGCGHWNTGNERNQRDRYVTGQHNEYRDRAFPNTSSMKSSYPAGAKGIPTDYPILKFGRDRRPYIKSESSSKFFVQDQDNGHHRRDVPSGRTFASDVGVGFSSPRISARRLISEPNTEDYIYVNEQKSNLYGVGEKFISNIEIDSEFYDDAENSDDFRWGQANTHRNSTTQFNEQTYSNIEADGSFSFGRSRYSVRQPRVLPPPSVASIQKSFYKDENEHPGHNAVSERGMRYSIKARNEPVEGTEYSAVHEENSGKLEIVDDQPENAGTEKQRTSSNSTLRCDSQSTLSVSSPPSSPTHLSRDDLDALNLPNTSASIGRINIPAVIQDNISVFLAAKERKDVVTTPNLESAVDEDEWAVENNELPEQEEYDEDNGYEVEDEVHEGEDESIDFIQGLADFHLDEEKSSHLMGNLSWDSMRVLKLGCRVMSLRKSPGRRTVYLLGQRLTS